MARTGFFSRLFQLIGGLFTGALADEETAHPEVAYENAIAGMIERYTELRSATAAIIVRRDQLGGRLGSQRDELTKVGAELELVIRTPDEALALMLIQRKNALEASLVELEGELESAARDADDAKAALLEVEGEIKKLKAEKQTMLAKMASAEARLWLQAELDGLSVEADVKALDNVREHIQNTIAQANLGHELHGSSLERRLSELRARNGDALARRELEEMRASLGIADKALPVGTSGTGTGTGTFTG
jgi:phage shock protein A